MTKMEDQGRAFIESLGRTEDDFDEHENRIICECGHEERFHDEPWNQYTPSGKSYWKRHCRAHKGYSTGAGDTPCRCTGFRPIKAGLYVYNRTGK
jgi:hypothetical protein